MNCPKCGNPLVPNMNFCTKCGTPVPQKPTAPQQPVRPQATVMPQQPVNKTQQAPARPKEFLQYDAPKKQPQNVVKPQPPKPPVQPTYPQNNPPKVQPQPVPQNFVTPQPTPPNVAIQSPKPPRKKKSNKNLPLIIVAAVLVLAVLASTIAVVPGIIRNKNEINAATEYIEEFPTLKQKTSLLVYDINKFPSEKYEIKVEKMFMGGVLNGVFKGKTILEDVSTEQIYDIDFKEDGDYRITLTDKTEPTESTETEVIEIVIIIDVKVDNDAEDAVDSVDIHSPENPAVQYLEATQEEIDFLTHIFARMHIQSDTYSPTDPEANKIAGNALTNLFYPVYFDCIEKYGWETPENVMHTEESDPEQIYSKDFIGHTKYPAENMNWLIRNMFNVEPKDTESYYTVDMDDGTTYTGCSWYVDGDYYYTYFDYVDVDPSYSCKIISRAQTDTNKLMLTLAVHSFSIYDYPEKENGTEVGVFELTAGVKEVDGKRVWSIEEWKKVEDKENSSTEITQQQSGNLEATDADWSDFNDMFSQVLLTCHKYDCTDTNDANAMAGYMITYIFSPVYSVCIEKYNLPDCESFWNSDGYSDPLKKYTGESDGFMRYDAHSVEWIMKNVFCVQPTMSICTGSTEGGPFTAWYRDGDYYYSHLFVSGDATWYDLNITDTQRTADGKYNIKLEATCTSYGDVQDAEQYEVTAKLKEVDGKRVWAFEKWVQVQ